MATAIKLDEIASVRRPLATLRTTPYGREPWIQPWRMIVADPPWRYRDKAGVRGAEAKYPTMAIEDICALRPLVEDDAVLFLWRVAQLQREALDVIDAWGFELKAELVWAKRTRHGKRAFGAGRRVRYEHEICLIAERGKPKVINHSIRSCFAAPMRRPHQKPDKIFEIASAMYGGTGLELFARDPRPGWTTWGREAPRGEAA